LRYDDTNPVKRTSEYVDSIKEISAGLDSDWEEREDLCPDYFEQLYQYALAADPER